MTRLIRLTILSAMTLALSACGGAKLGGGKEGAAQAAFQASQPAGRGSKTGQSLVNQALASGAGSLTLTASCATSGTASLVLDTSGTPTDGALLHYAVTYDACNEDGKNEYNGTVATTIKLAIDLSGGGASISTHLQGKLEIDGEVSDSLDADVTLRMDLTATSARAGSIKVVLDGTIKTESGSYTYANETLTLTAGVLPHD